MSSKVEQVDQCAKALRAWFKSQDISPAMACATMMELTAQLMVERTRDVRDLDVGCSIVTELLHTNLIRQLVKSK